MMKNNYTFLILMLSVLTLASYDSVAQHITDDIVYRLRGFDTLRLDQSGALEYDKNERKKIAEFWQKLKQLNKYERLQRVLQGETKFSLAGDEANGDMLYKFSSSVELSRGVFPEQLKIRTSVGVVVDDNSFAENVSNLGLAYDFHPKSRNNLGVENSVFASRTRNAYLGVDQRYEVGLAKGFYFYSKNLTRAGKKEMGVFNLVKTDKSSINKKQDQWKLCHEFCVGMNSKLSEEDVSNLAEVDHVTKMSIKKIFSKSRVGILAGVFLETEKITSADSLMAVDTAFYYSESFEPKHKLRWELRPTFDFKPDDTWQIKIRPYFKLPMPWNWYAKAVNDEGKRRFDYRIDLESSVSIRLDNRQSMYKAVALNVIYKLAYDHAPERRVLSQFQDLSGGPLLFSAKDLHQEYKLSLQVKF